MLALVPVELTEEMREAGHRACPFGISDSALRQAWDAMLHAAPAHLTPQHQGVSAAIASTPAGNYAVLPVEATPAMVDAVSSLDEYSSFDPWSIWKTMVAVAPAPDKESLLALGRAVVPVRPTEEMLEAARRTVAAAYPLNHYLRLHEALLRCAWETMIEAAQSSPWTVEPSASSSRRRLLSARDMKAVQERLEADYEAKMESYRRELWPPDGLPPNSPCREDLLHTLFCVHDATSSACTVEQVNDKFRCRVCGRERP